MAESKRFWNRGTGTSNLLSMMVGAPHGLHGHGATKSEERGDLYRMDPLLTLVIRIQVSFAVAVAQPWAGYIYISGSAPYLSLGFSSDPLLHIPRLSRKTCWQSPSKHFTVISLSCSRPRFCGADLAHLLRTSPHLTRARNL